MRRVLRSFAAALTLPLAAACDDPTELTATASVISDTVAVYALSGTDFSLPSAVNFPEMAVVRTTGAFNFDVGFDINSAGEIVLYPMMLLAEDPTGQSYIHPVGLQKVEGSFESLTRAPESGYEFEEPLVVAIDDVVAVQVAALIYCGFPYPETIYAKLSVIDVDPVERRMWVAVTVDPSCGFRSFLPGIPRD
jgi:hypothetical protein